MATSLPPKPTGVLPSTYAPPTPIAPAPFAPAPEVPAEWSATQAALFRFTFVYLGIYCIGFPLDVLSFVTTRPERVYTAAWHRLVPWVAAHVLHLAKPITIFPAGSGDTTYNYVELLITVAIAVMAAAAWTAVAKRRTYRELHHYLRIGVRYFLAVTMMTYGLAKVIKTQFPAPSLSTLMEPYGASSPMRLLWTFMGYSTVYNLYAGLAELSGMLLFFRRTTTLGALLVAAAMSNVAVLNYAYDVPVTLFATHLCLIALFLAGPELRRLADVFFFHRGVPPERLVPHIADRRWRRAQLAAKTVVIAGMSFILVKQDLSYYRQLNPAARGPLYGIYDVDSMTVGDVPRPALLGDGQRWRRVYIDVGSTFATVTMNDSIRRFLVRIDTVAHQIALAPPASLQQAGILHGGTLSYVALPDRSLDVKGSLAGTAIAAHLRRLDPDSLLLWRRGFHWINEVPYQR